MVETEIVEHSQPRPRSANPSGGSGGLQRWTQSVWRRGVHCRGSQRSSSVLNCVEHPAANLSRIHLEDFDAIVLYESGGSGGTECFFLDESYGEQRESIEKMLPKYQPKRGGDLG